MIEKVCWIRGMAASALLSSILVISLPLATFASTEIGPHVIQRHIGTAVSALPTPIQNSTDWIKDEPDDVFKPLDMLRHELIEINERNKNSPHTRSLDRMVIIEGPEELARKSAEIGDFKFLELGSGATRRLYELGNQPYGLTCSRRMEVKFVDVGCFTNPLAYYSAYLKYNMTLFELAPANIKELCHVDQVELEKQMRMEAIRATEWERRYPSTEAKPAQ